MTFRKIGLDKNSTGLVKDVLSNPRKSGNLYTKKKNFYKIKYVVLWLLLLLSTLEKKLPLGLGPTNSN